jgi:hypothetical protein
MSEEDQRRRHPRIATQQPVWVEGQDVRVAAEVRNMSKGGMFVVSKEEPPAIGTTLEIKFHDPLEGEVHLRTEVVWREENTVTSKLGLRVLDSHGPDSHGMDTFARVVSRYEASSSLKNVRIDSSAPTQRPPKPETPDE